MKGLPIRLSALLLLALILISFNLPAQVQTRGVTRYHSVAKGETLYQIARQYKVKVEDIMEWNNMSYEQGASLYVGQELAVSPVEPVASDARYQVNYYTPEQSQTEAAPQQPAPSGERAAPENPYQPTQGAPAGTRSMGNTSTRALYDAARNRTEDLSNYAGQVLSETGYYTPEQIGRLQATRKRYALIVGISEYQTVKSLRYPDDDAYKFYSFLRSPEGGAIPYNNATILVNENATRAKIMHWLEEFSRKAGENDVLLFYFAGHGIKGAFLPNDYDGYNNLISFEDVLNTIQNSRASMRWLIADACHAGSFTNITPGADYEDEILARAKESYASIPQGGVAIMSATSEELAIEDRGLAQGVFTYYLINGLEGEADSNRDRIVTLAELFTFLKGQVSSYSQGTQTPQMIGSHNIDAKIPVSVVR